MDESLAQILSGVAALGVGGGSVGGVTWYLLRGLIADLRTQLTKATDRIERLETQELAAIKTRMATYEAGCVAHQHELADRLRTLDQLASDEKNTIGWLKKLDGKLDRISEAQAATGAKQEATTTWLSNLDAQHQSHVHNPSIHGGK